MPNTDHTALFRLPSPTVSSFKLPSTIKRNAISGCESAIFSTFALTAMASVTSRFKNLRRAGTLANRSSAITVVPTAQPRSVMSTISPQLTSICAPSAASGVLDRMRRRETAAMAAKASPRKPSVAMPSRSSGSLILLVACRLIAMGRSSGGMPCPLSDTRIKVTPPF